MTSFISSLAYEPGFSPCWEGLDLKSAIDATPRLYGVSFGNGNDGVSHHWPNLYVRTSDPFTLAACAMLSDFKPGDGIAFALEAMEIDGERDYGVSATIYDPPVDDMDDSRDHSECEDGEDCEGCDQCEPDEMKPWSSVNGAWMIVEVWPESEPNERSSCMRYDSLEEAFTADLIELASNV